MDDILLQEVDDFIQTDLSNVKYPHVRIAGVTTEEEVIYFHKKFCDEGKSLPLYLAFENTYKCIGSFELTLDNLLVVRSIDNYKLDLIVAEDKVIPIDIENPVKLIKFITLAE